MLLFNIMEKDTICAPATAEGGALGIIRIAGAEAIAITNEILDKDLSKVSSNSLTFGNVCDADGKTIDEVVVSVFRKPHSYTGEDIVEISCHGSSYISRTIIQRLIDRGCRQALPGEFTQRAFENGKLDLTQAEAVADLIAATNEANHRTALNQLKGHISSRLGSLRKQLLRLTSLLELELDFSDHEELEFADRKELLNLSQHIREEISALSHSFQTGKALKEGIAVAIIGRTNVGKSTLLNKLLNEEKAIVSNIHGTTRDAIEDTTTINGVTFRFIDTAGIRATQDSVEQMGIELTYQKAKQAQIILWIIDDAPSVEEIDNMLQLTKDKRLVTVCNKIDKNNHAETYIFKQLKDYFVNIDKNIPVVKISAKNGTNINLLEQTIYNVADIPEYKQNITIITSARHYEALTRAKNSLDRVIDGLNSNITAELVAADLNQALEQLGEITGGKITPNDTLHSIFQHFCVGK